MIIILLILNLWTSYEITLEDVNNEKKRCQKIIADIYKGNKKYFDAIKINKPSNINYTYELAGEKDIVLDIYHTYNSINTKINIENNETYEVLLDTGSFEFLLFSDEAKSSRHTFEPYECKDNDICKYTTNNENIEKKYGSLHVLGRECNLKFNIKNNRFYRKFLLVNTIKKESNNVDFDALLGLGPNNNSEKLNKIPFSTSLNRKYLKFDLKINKLIFSDQCKLESKFMNEIKSNEKNFFGTNIYLKSNKNTTWRFPIIFDTGTTFISLPKSTKKFFKKLFSSCKLDDKTITCNNSVILPDITFVINKIEYKLKSEDYIYYKNKETKTITLGFSFSDEDFGILGLTFLKNKVFCHDAIKNITYLEADTKRKFGLIKILILIFSILLIIGVITFAIIKYKKNKIIEINDSTKEDLDYFKKFKNKKNIYVNK